MWYVEKRNEELEKWKLYQHKQNAFRIMSAYQTICQLKRQGWINVQGPSRDIKNRKE